jgi:hypothetical protein
VRTDPTDNGGLFIGRRPGTQPVRYGRLPQRGSRRRAVIDGVLSAALLVAMVLLTAAVWGPLPAGAMWVASQLSSDNAGLWVVIAFALAVLGIFVALRGLRMLDLVWILLRRAAGVDQRSGVLGRVFLGTTIVVLPIFGYWLIFIGGLRPTFGIDG